MTEKLKKKYMFQEVEAEMQRLWSEEQVYRFDPESGKEIYSIDTPPPTVSGSLHIGHIFSYTQAEMIARYRRMRGYEVYYPFGFDDNGLPTERLVERERGITARELPIGAFQESCLKVSGSYEEQFRQIWKSMGFSADWMMQYETISEEVQKLSQELFLELAKNGKAYQKESPVLWCTQCQTSIAQAELESRDIPSAFHYINFQIEGRSVLIATTRPELLPGCVCLFVHPEDERFSHLIGKEAVVPLYHTVIPVLADDEVDQEKGTGVVMCATFGDIADVHWYEKYKLPYLSIITPEGKIRDEIAYIGGKSVKEARRSIICQLQKEKAWVRSKELSHSVAVHERCGYETEIIWSRQWYIDILSDREAYLKAADQIQWYPPQMKSRYIAWVENLKWDWCISRQRFFGVPFPVWYCSNCHKPAFAEPEELPVTPLETEYRGVCSCGCSSFYPEKAVMDTWATSSVTPLLHKRRSGQLYPMSMRAHAHEIIRTWTFYSIARSLMHTGQLPWKELMISGFVLAKRGEKISKSKQNAVMDPKGLIQEHSADVLRYWAANARLGTDTFFDTDELSLAKRFITKLWNAAKFVLQHLEDYAFPAFLEEVDPTLSAPQWSEELLPVDRWIIHRSWQTASQAVKYLDQYEVGLARHVIDSFFWNDFCDDYLEIVKERVYRPDLHGEQARMSAQTALSYSLLQILKLYGIFTPHITEYLYQQYYRQYVKKVSVHQLLWAAEYSYSEDLLEFGVSISWAIRKVRKYKSENQLSMKSEIDRVVISVKPLHMEWMKQTERDIYACTKAKEVVYLG